MTLLLGFVAVAVFLAVIGLMYLDAPVVDPDHPWAEPSHLDALDGVRRRGNADTGAAREALDGGARQ